LNVLPNQDNARAQPFKDAHRLARGAPAAANEKKEIWEAIPPHILQPDVAVAPICGENG